MEKGDSGERGPPFGSKTKLPTKYGQRLPNFQRAEIEE